MLANSQVEISTVVPQKPIAIGESFQVQYVLIGAEAANIRQPAFSDNFRIIAGPSLYTGTKKSGNQLLPVQNFVYTVVATRSGILSVARTSAVSNGIVYFSKEAFVTVMSKGESLRHKENTHAAYFLLPGEDPYQRIRKNLFVKVQVNKKHCFVGEPVEAVFKLYSRLESRSDIVKNPGFYGFTVYDMVNLSDKKMETEKISGELFDVHTIRKVQLFPLQSGVFSVDAMEIRNKVEFSRSSVDKKPEQEIAEGLFGNDEAESPKEGTETFETTLRTEPISITVKPIPVNNQPPAYNGATGRFTIAAMLVSNNLFKNEEGKLEITISGTGNFTQLSAPVIEWPAGD